MGTSRTVGETRTEDPRGLPPLTAARALQQTCALLPHLHPLLQDHDECMPLLEREFVQLRAVHGAARRRGAGLGLGWLVVLHLLLLLLLLA